MKGSESRFQVQMEGLGWEVALRLRCPRERWGLLGGGVTACPGLRGDGTAL